MSELAPQPPVVQPRALEGIGCIMLGMMLFVVQDGMMKSLLGTYPIWLLIVARGVVSILILGPAILYLGHPHRLLSPLWPLHLLRAALFTIGFSMFYTAFPFMGLAEVSTIFFSAPLMTAIIAAFWLGESIGPHRIGALIAGFAGVIIAMNPTGDAFHWIAVLPLICAATYAMSQIIARRIGSRESTLTVGLYTIAFAGLLMVPTGWIVNQIFDFGPEFKHLRWAWPALSTAEIVTLGLLGAVGMVGYTLLSRAYQVANASLVAPFDYTYLPFATIMAYFVWNEKPTQTTLIGMGMIMVSGLYLGYRELRNERGHIEPLPVAEAVIAPGNPTAPMSLGAEIEDHAEIMPED